MLRGRMIANGSQTFDGKVFRMGKALLLSFEVYCRSLMEYFGLHDELIYNEEGLRDLTK